MQCTVASLKAGAKTLTSICFMDAFIYSIACCGKRFSMGIEADLSRGLIRLKKTEEEEEVEDGNITAIMNK